MKVTKDNKRWSSYFSVKNDKNNGWIYYQKKSKDDEYFKFSCNINDNNLYEKLIKESYKKDNSNKLEGIYDKISINAMNENNLSINEIRKLNNINAKEIVNDSYGNEDDKCSYTYSLEEEVLTIIYSNKYNKILNMSYQGNHHNTIKTVEAHTGDRDNEYKFASISKNVDSFEIQKKLINIIKAK